MIPLSYFLIAWVVLLGLFAIMLLLTLVQMLRYGVTSPSTYISTFLFLAVVAVVVMGVGSYASTVDWGTGVPVFSDNLNPFAPATDAYDPL